LYKIITEHEIELNEMPFHGITRKTFFSFLLAGYKARNENVAKVKELLVHTLGNLFKTSIFPVSVAVAYI